MIPVIYNTTPQYGNSPAGYYDVPAELEDEFQTWDRDKQETYFVPISSAHLQPYLAIPPQVGDKILATNGKFKVTIRKIYHTVNSFTKEPCLLLDVS